MTPISLRDAFGLAIADRSSELGEDRALGTANERLSRLQPGLGELSSSVDPCPKSQNPLQPERAQAHHDPRGSAAGSACFASWGGWRWRLRTRVVKRRAQ